jgi:putative redox protein
MEITVTFPGGKKVNAEINGAVIQTDQPRTEGGDGTAPSPFVHFLASFGTCAGIYVLSFCRERGIPTDGITLTERFEQITQNGKSKLNRIILDINIPPDFPEKYRHALVKAADLCAVKKAIMDPPQFEINAVVRR